MDVEIWRDPPRARAPKAPRNRRFIRPTLVGLFGTALLHGLIIQSVYLKYGHLMTQPLEKTRLGIAAQTIAGDTEAFVLMQLPMLASYNNIASLSPSQLQQLKKIRLREPLTPDPPAPIDIEVLPLKDESRSQGLADGGEVTEHARLAGIYTGQIKARVERLWRRPRTPINEIAEASTDAAQSFQCRVQIVQDDMGSVQEILLIHCNGSLAWQQSLLTAIRQASPLPAPPSDKVFSSSIALDFIGFSYAAGSTEDEYETLVPATARTQ